MRTLEERFCVIEDVIKGIYADCNLHIEMWENDKFDMDQANPYVLVFKIKAVLEELLEGKK